MYNNSTARETVPNRPVAIEEIKNSGHKVLWPRSPTPFNVANSLPEKKNNFNILCTVKYYMMIILSNSIEGTLLS